MDFIEYILCCQTDVQNIDFVVDCLKLGKEIRYWSDIGLSDSFSISNAFIKPQESNQDGFFNEIHLDDFYRTPK